MNRSDVSCSPKLLVVCDLQTAALNSLPQSPRRALVDFIRVVVHVGRQHHYRNTSSPFLIVWSGLCFSKDYQEIPESHKVFGALKRMHRLTKGTSTFFVKGEKTTNFVLPTGEMDTILWRSILSPPSKDDWMSCINNSIRDGDSCNADAPEVTLVGIRTAQSILSTAQLLCDFGWKVTVIEECVLDDDEERHKATVKHLLPIYADVVSLAEWMEKNGAYESETSFLREMDLDPNVRYLCDCGRGGHSFLYQQHLLMFHQGWARYPLQPWYTDSFSGKSYTCPLGKRVIDYCDEPQFSGYCMYIKGREWLDEKDKLWELVPELMPKTYLIDKGALIRPNGDDGDIVTPTGPFFLKECMKNGGKAVQVVDTLETAFSMAKEKSSKFVVQEHVSNPLLTIANQKCHIKAYFLLIEESGRWELRMYSEPFLSVSPNQWSETDLRTETQVTVKRTKRVRKDHECEIWPAGWPSSYESVRDVVAQVVERAVAQGKLARRNTAKRQFEVFSADVMIDTSHQAWLIECNFGCVLFDPKIGQPLTTIGLKTYQTLYELQGEACEVNDHELLAGTVALVFNQRATATNTKWVLIGTFHSN